MAKHSVILLAIMVLVDAPVGAHADEPPNRESVGQPANSREYAPKEIVLDDGANVCPGSWWRWDKMRDVLAEERHLAASPDGSRLVYIRKRDEDTLVYDSGRQIAGTWGAVERVHVSEDGRHVAVVGWPRDNQRKVVQHTSDSLLGAPESSKLVGMDLDKTLWYDGRALRLQGEAVDSYATSSDLRHVALIESRMQSRTEGAGRSGRWIKVRIISWHEYRLVLNGRPMGWAKEEIAPESVRISPDGRRAIYKQGGVSHINGEKLPVGANCEETHFSADGRRLAMKLTGAVFEGGAYRDWARYWVDGELEPVYERPQDFLFSPDGRHYAYVAYVQGAGAPECRIIVDGKELDGRWSAATLGFTSTGRLWYVAREPGDSSDALILDGSKLAEGRPIERVIPSADGEHLVCVARNRDSLIELTLDGKGIDGFPKTRDLQAVVLSADGKRIAWAIGHHPTELFLDGKQHLQSGRLYAMRFSDDGNTFAAIVQPREKDGCAVFVDGKELGYYDVAIPGPDAPRIYPNGRVEFLAIKEGKLVRVIADPKSSS